MRQPALSDVVQVLDVRYEDSDVRCGECSKRLVVDVGGSIFGPVDNVLFCLHCDAWTPERGWK